MLVGFRDGLRLLLGVAPSLVAACAISGSPATTCAPPAAVRSVTELYFGRSIPGGGEVTEAEWSRFLDEVITPRFPEGITVLDADGQYRMADGAITRERSKVLIVIAASRDAEVAAAIDAYKERFRQESVLRRDTTSCISFR